MVVSDDSGVEIDGAVDIGDNGWLLVPYHLRLFVRFENATHIHTLDLSIFRSPPRASPFNAIVSTESGRNLPLSGSVLTPVAVAEEPSYRRFCY
jgi:hypothetical protein